MSYAKSLVNPREMAWDMIPYQPREPIRDLFQAALSNGSVNHCLNMFGVSKMSTLSSISPVHFHLAINALTAYLTLLNAGHTLEDLGLTWIEQHVTAPHMLFKSSDEEVDLAGRTLRATADRLHLRLISREALLIQLQAYLAEMQANLKRVELNAKPF